MMASQKRPVPGTRMPAALTVVVAAVGLGLNLRASFQLSPHLHERFDVSLGAYVLLMALPVLVAALVRLPVGVLTDRYGVRVMFPVVSLVSAASVIVMGLSDSLPVVIVAGSAAGTAGAAFVVGASLVSRSFPYGRRGLAFGFFGLGVAFAGVISAAWWGFDPVGRQSALLLGGLLVGFAGLSAVVFHDPGVPWTGSPIRRCAEMIRLAATSSLTLLYALALGGILSIAVYLPVYLTTVVRMEWFHAVALTALVIVLASLARLAGGWWTDRRPTARLVMVCYSIAAGLCALAALAPRSVWPTVPVIVGIVVCDGVASGALLALIGKAARPDSVGAVMGASSAAGALGALVPPLLMAGVDRLSHSYSPGWALLAATLLAAALYVRTHGLHIGLGLPVQFEPEPSPTTMTVAVLGELDTRLGTAAVVARLAELAVSDELVVVYGADERVRPRLTAQALAVGLRDRLPRHSVVAVGVTPQTPALGRDALLLGEYVEAGTLAIAVTPTADLRNVAADLSIFLQADRVLVVSYTPAEGAELHQV